MNYIKKWPSGWHNISAQCKKSVMKPQQQNTDVKGHSHVYVQKPDGKQINVPAPDPETLQDVPDNEMAQTADKTPTTHSEEVRSGEAG